jgi:hypothetical protein
MRGDMRGKREEAAQPSICAHGNAGDDHPSYRLYARLRSITPAHFRADAPEHARELTAGLTSAQIAAAAD